MKEQQCAQKVKEVLQSTVQRTSLYALPEEHPIQKVLERLERRYKLKGTCPKFPLAEAAKTMDLSNTRNLEIIDPKPLKPWRKPAFKTIDLEEDEEKATEKIINLM